MNSRSETPLALRHAWEPSGPGVIEEYLDDFCLPLAEVMPKRKVAEYRVLDLKSHAWSDFEPH